MYLQNKYSKYYYSIVKRAKSRVLVKGTYTENHHIIPQSFFKSKSKTGWLEGNSESPDNKVKLTAKEHITCHRLLVRMTTGKAKMKMAFAAWRMVFACKKHNRGRVSSRTYESAKLDMIAARKASKGSYTHTTKTKNKIGKGNKGLRKGKTLIELYGEDKAAEWQLNSSKSRTGKKRGAQSAEWRSNISTGLTGKFKGVKKSDSTRKNMAAGRIGKKVYNNGVKSILCYPDSIPVDYVAGRLPKN